MRAWLAAAAGALLLTIAIAITAPASLLDSRLAEATDGRMRIAGAMGTVWNGSGDLVLLPRGTRRPLAWHIDAWPLLTGEVRGTVAMDGSAAQHAEFAYGRGRAALRGFDADLPMDTLLQSAGVPAALGSAGGNLGAHVERFAQTPGALDADLSLRWQDASVPAPTPGVRLALGDIKLELRGSGPEIGGPLSNRGGDVEIAGRVTLDATLASRLDATIRPRPGIDRDHADALATALALIGAPDGQGGYRIAWPR
jgi:type II secretion system (T2SS) protein N